METLVNQTIDKVTKGKSGEHKEYGMWQQWSFTLIGDNKRYSYFEKNNIVPVSGMKLLVLKYEIEPKDGKTYYNVKSLEPAIEPTSKAVNQLNQEANNGFNNNRDASFYVSYVKDIIVAKIDQGLQEKDTSVKELAMECTIIGLQMLAQVNGDNNGNGKTQTSQRPHSGTTSTAETIQALTTMLNGSDLPETNKQVWLDKLETATDNKIGAIKKALEDLIKPLPF